MLRAEPVVTAQVSLHLAKLACPVRTKHTDSLAARQCGLRPDPWPAMHLNLIHCPARSPIHITLFGYGTRPSELTHSIAQVAPTAFQRKEWADCLS